MAQDSRELKKLQKLWYRKLAKEGFDDIEQDDGNLKLWSSHFFKARFNATLFEAKESYYRMARHFLNDHVFKDQKTKLIWQLHSDGVSIRDIVKALKAKGYRTHKDAVHHTIQLLTQQMRVVYGQDRFSSDT